MTQEMNENARQVYARIIDIVELAQSKGFAGQDIFHGVARAFGHALSGVEPAAAVEFLRRDADRIERLHSTPTTETKQ